MYRVGTAANPRVLRWGCSIQQTTSSSRYATSSFSLFSSLAWSDTNINEPYHSSSFLLFSSLELSDTTIYEPSMRARLGTTAHLCIVVFSNRELYRFGTAANLRVFRCGCSIQQTTSFSRYSPTRCGTTLSSKDNLHHANDF